MSDASPLGFGKFVPGFEFLQNLAKGASSNIPQLPSLANWVAPTISVEELEKRIEELKSVQFWLEQNSRALAATIQALEVQKMTLATLKGMNFSVGDVANAFKLKTADTVMEGVHKAGETLAHAAQAVSGAASRVAEKAAPEAAATAPAAKKAKAGARSKPKAAAAAAPGLVDPMQWWGALTQQVQHIAANAMKDAAKQNGPGSPPPAWTPGACGPCRAPSGEPPPRLPSNLPRPPAPRQGRHASPRPARRPRAPPPRPRRARRDEGRRAPLRPPFIAFAAALFPSAGHRAVHPACTAALRRRAKAAFLSGSPEHLSPIDTDPALVPAVRGHAATAGLPGVHQSRRAGPARGQ